MAVGQVQETRRGHRQRRRSCRPRRTTVGEVISGNTAQSLPLNGRNIGQLAAARCPGTDDLQPARLHEHRQHQHEPAVRQRQPRADEQLHRRRPRRERDDRQPRRLPAEPGCAWPRSASRPTTTRPTPATSAARWSAASSSRARNMLRGNVFEFYRNSDFDANTWENNASRAPKQERKPAHLRRHARRSARQGQAVLLRRLPGLAAGCARASARRRSRPRPGAAAICRASPRRSAIRTTGQPFPGNQIPANRISPVARALLNDTAELPAAESHRAAAASPATSSAKRCFTIRAHQGDAPRGLEPPRPTTSSSAATRLPPTRTARDVQPFPLVFATRNDQPFYNVGVQLEPHLRADASSTSCSSASATSR